MGEEVGEQAGRKAAFTFTEEQDQFRDMVQRFLSDKSPTTEVRRLMDSQDGYDPQVWTQLCGDLGLTSITVPEAYGGAGFGAVELGIVMEQLGRTLACTPYFSTIVLAANSILNAAHDAQKADLLPALAAGQRLATLAVTEPNGRWDVGGIETVARAEGAGYVINGSKSFVVDGLIADLIVVVAGSSDSDGVSTFIVNGSGPGVARSALASTDATRKLARLEFDDAPAELIGELHAGAAPLARTLDQAATALANEMVGGAAALLQSAVDYAQMRMQFGRAIGSFQAIKHKCADMLLDVELARSAAYQAAQAEAADDPEFPALASLAKASASEAYLRTAASCIQIHGGIGFTWDNDTHLWFKRAKSSEVFLGDPSYHREMLMQRWGY